MTKRTRSIVSSLVLSALAGSSLWAQTPEGRWKKGADIVNEAHRPVKGTHQRPSKGGVKVEASASGASRVATDRVARALALQAKQAKAEKLITELYGLELNRDDTRGAKEENYRLAQKTSIKYHKLLSEGLAGGVLGTALLVGVTPSPVVSIAKGVAGVVASGVGLGLVVMADFIVEPELDLYLKRAAKYAIRERDQNDQIRAKTEELRRLQIEISTAQD